MDGSRDQFLVSWTSLQYLGCWASITITFNLGRPIVLHVSHGLFPAYGVFFPYFYFKFFCPRLTLKSWSLGAASMEKQWRILEFYSGIGGMVVLLPLLFTSNRIKFRVRVRVFANPRLYLQRYSLMRAGINGEVIEAFDINDTANDVYELNFGHRPFQVLNLSMNFTAHIRNCVMQVVDESEWYQTATISLLLLGFIDFFFSATEITCMFI